MKHKQVEQQNFGTVTELLRQSCLNREDQLLFIEKRKDGHRITNRRWEQELLETVGKVRNLEAQHIGVICDLTYQCILCLYAVMVAGKVVVPLEADLTADSLDK